MSNTQHRTATNVTAQNRQSMICLALSYCLGLALIFIVPSQAANMSSKEYNIFVLVWSIAAIIGVCIGVVYQALSVESRLRTALAVTSLFLAFALLAVSPPVMSFVGGNFYGFLVSALGA